MSRLTYVLSKIKQPKEALTLINSWKMRNDKIVFTNGCFDILHKGHVTYLAKAADLGNKLVVAVNSDASVKRQNKGSDRPINDEQARMQVLASLGFVDLLVLFDEDTPLELITYFEPDVLAKGADYDPEEKDPNSKKYIVGSAEVKKYGGTVCAIDLEAGFSTTAIIGKIKQ